MQDDFLPQLFRNLHVATEHLEIMVRQEASDSSTHDSLTEKLRDLKSDSEGLGTPACWMYKLSSDRSCPTTPVVTDSFKVMGHSRGHHGGHSGSRVHRYYRDYVTLRYIKDQLLRSMEVVAELKVGGE